MPKIHKYLRDWLRTLGACEEALEWCGKRRSLKRAWKECKITYWMEWLVDVMAGEPGWLTHRELDRVYSKQLIYESKLHPSDFFYDETIRRSRAFLRRNIKPGPWPGEME